MEVLLDVLRQVADAVEAANEGEVGVVEGDLLAVLGSPMLNIHAGILGDHMGLYQLELPPGLVVLVVEVEEQHLHRGEVQPGDRLLVKLLSCNAMEVVADVGTLGHDEHGLGVCQTCLLQMRDHLVAVLGKCEVVLLHELHLPAVVEAMDRGPHAERHRPNLQEVYEAVADAVGHRRLGVVIEVPGNVPQRQPVRDLCVLDEPISD